MSDMMVESSACATACKSSLLEDSTWQRHLSDASTALPQEGDHTWFRGESTASEDCVSGGDCVIGASAHQEKAATMPKDWRPQTCLLRQQLADEFRSQMEGTKELECPDVLTSSTRDWRPLTVALRRALCARNGVEGEDSNLNNSAHREGQNSESKETFNKLKMEDQIHFNQCVCPSTVTADTLDWRPLVVNLRQQLTAKKTQASTQATSDRIESPNRTGAYTALVLLLLAMLLSCLFLPQAVASVLVSLCVSVTFVGLIVPGQLLPLVAVLVIAGTHILGTAGLISYMAPPL